MYLRCIPFKHNFHFWQSIFNLSKNENKRSWLENKYTVYQYLSICALQASYTPPHVFSLSGLRGRRFVISSSALHSNTWQSTISYRCEQSKTQFVFYFICGIQRESWVQSPLVTRIVWLKGTPSVTKWIQHQTFFSV